MGLLLLGLVSFVSWFMSLLAGAGSPLVLIPLVNVLCGAGAVAPVITLGMLLGNGQRSLMLWRQINWTMTGWYLPGMACGAVLGAYGFSRIQWDWLQWILALGLIAMALNQWLGKGEIQVKIRAWYFLPLGFLNAIASAFIGSTGPILNPLYLNYGLVKEDLIATKAFHNMVLHLIKLVAYVYFGILQPEHWGYGLVIGAAALPGNWLGQRVLSRMNPVQFKQAVVAFVAFSGVVMLWQQAVLVF